MQNVAFTLYFFSRSRMLSVNAPGPSSKVSATALEPVVEIEPNGPWPVAAPPGGVAGLVVGGLVVGFGDGLAGVGVGGVGLALVAFALPLGLPLALPSAFGDGLWCVEARAA